MSVVSEATGAETCMTTGPTSMIAPKGEAELRANTIVSLMARQIEDGDVVATGVASPLAILAIAVARATHAPNLAYLACVGSLDPDLSQLHTSPEDLRYLDGRTAEVTIPDLFDHARRDRISVVFFGAAEVDGHGQTNMTAAGTLSQPKVKFPGLAGAASLRRWVRRPVLVVPRQSKRALVPEVQIASTTDPNRRTTLITDLAVFEVGSPQASLIARHPWTTDAELDDKTGFRFTRAEEVRVTPLPDERTALAIRSIDSNQLRHSLVG
jgi:glutaconate CoA-transferase subunit B